MNILEILILITIIATCLIYIINQLVKPFKNNGNPCASCPYAKGCSMKDSNPTKCKTYK